MAQIEFKGESVECPICGASFYLSGEELAWWDRHGLHRQKKCPDCRKKARHKRITGDKTEFSSDEEFQRTMDRAKGLIADWERREVRR